MSLTIFAKSSIVYVLLGSKYAYVISIAPYRVRLTKWISEKTNLVHQLALRYSLCS